MAISFKSLSSSKIEKTTVITSTQSWTTPSDVTSCEVTLISGGGGGGGYNTTNGIAGGGGGGGGYVIKSITVSPSTAYTLTIGAGGAGGSLNSDAAAGGTTSFGSLATVVGGGPGYGTTQYQSNFTFGVGACGGGERGGTGVAAGGGGGMSSPGAVAVGYTQSPIQLSTGFVPGTIGFGGSSSGSGDPTVPAHGGVGINGFCGGGNGGFAYANNTSGPTAMPSTANSGAGRGAFVSSAGIHQSATAGATNSGSGGGGGARNNAYASPGGNGGSGYMIIKYWSAL